MTNLKRWLNSPDELLAEIEREQARRHLLNFTKFTYPRYVIDPFHELVAGTLDRVVRGECKRLMIFAPPQHGKSELVSVRLPAFWLGKRPDDPVIITSYGASLAHNKSKAARDIVEAREYAELFPEVKVDQSSRAKNLWELATPNRGAVVAAGVGGPIIGHGAALGIIDDPFENWEQAQSPTIRNRVWDWWKGTFRTRVWEDGAIVLIMTRWHEDDVAGRLLAYQAEQWEVLRLPAIAETQADWDRRNQKMHLPQGLPDPLGREPGEPLSPSRYSKGALVEIEGDVGPQVWSAEYQGAPTPPEGNKFKREWFEIVPVGPTGRRVRRGRYWDLAATKGGGKRTAGVLLAIAPDEQIFIEDVVYGQWGTDQRNKVIKQTAALDHQRYGNRGKLWFEQEPGSSGKDAVVALVTYLAGYAVSPDRVTGDKDVRLEPFEAQAGVRGIKLVQGKWNGVYIEEMCAVPNGVFRDMADASGGAYNKLRKSGWVRGSAG